MPHGRSALLHVTQVFDDLDDLITVENMRLGRNDDQVARDSVQRARRFGVTCDLDNDSDKARSGFHALGVLFNDCMFAGRSRYRSETWIFGGAAEPDLLQATDEELTALLQANHARLVGAAEPLLSAHITRWPRALPHYTLELERTLATLPPLPPHVTLVGNYLGQIGLAKILERAYQAAAQLEECI